MPDRSAANAPRHGLPGSGRSDHAGDGLALGIIELGGLARRLAVQETDKASLVKVQHPIPDDLKPHPADFRRFGARCAVTNRGKSQKPTSLGSNFGFLRQTRKRARKISAQVIGADMTNFLGSPVESDSMSSGNPRKSQFQGFGIRPWIGVAHIDV